MEVHPPEHPIHTWRDFFIHIATIVVGLLIAIGLEQSVEWMHHRHLVHTAHHNLRLEAERNERKYNENEAALAQTRARLLHDLQTLHAIQHDPSAARGARLTATWSWESFEESAYNTARETNAFSYMSYDAVQDIDSVYRQQHYIDDALKDFWHANYRIYEPLAGNRTLADLNPAEIAQTLQSTSEALSSLDLLHDLMRSIGAEYHRLATE